MKRQVSEKTLELNVAAELLQVIRVFRDAARLSGWASNRIKRHDGGWMS